MEAIVDLGGGGGVVETVLAGLEAAAACEAEDLELIAGAQDAGLLELAAHLERAGAGGDVDELLGVRAVGDEEEKGDGGHDDKDQQEQNFQQSGCESQGEPPQRTV